MLAGPDTRLEQVYAQAGLGGLLRRNNRRVVLAEILRQAVDTAHHLGASALARRAETELQRHRGQTPPSAARRA